MVQSLPRGGFCLAAKPDPGPKADRTNCHHTGGIGFPACAKINQRAAISESENSTTNNRKISAKPARNEREKVTLLRYMNNKINNIIIGKKYPSVDMVAGLRSFVSGRVLFGGGIRL
jgi:hypothetical protein